MPDSQQPPFQGPAYHERDLDALLSAEAGSTPLALRPVASTLAALRAAPTRREVSDEAAARAAFRALAAPTMPWTAPPECETVTADALALPLAEHLLPPADHRPTRHRRRRGRATRSGRGPVIALTSVAAAAVIVIAVALTGALPGSIGQTLSFGGHSTQAAASSSSGARSGQTSRSLDGTGGAPLQTPSATVTGTASVSPSATTAPDTLCREFYESAGPSRQRDRTKLHALFQQLTTLAVGRGQVFTYCFRILGSSWFKAQRPYPTPSFSGYPGGPGDRGQSSPSTGNNGTGSTGNANSGAGDTGPGNSGVGDSAPSTGAGASASSGAGAGAGAKVGASASAGVGASAGPTTAGANAGQGQRSYAGLGGESKLGRIPVGLPGTPENGAAGSPGVRAARSTG